MKGMDRISAALIFAASVCGWGCHLILPFSSEFADSISDTFIDGGSDMTIDSLADVLPDSQLPDALKPDIDLCFNVTCVYGACNPATGKCDCDVGFDGIGCDKCAYAYGPDYPTCNALSPAISTISPLYIGCPGGIGYCMSYDITKKEVPVTFDFTNARKYKVKFVWLSGNPSSMGSLETDTAPATPIELDKYYDLPAANTNVAQKFTIKWKVGGPGPMDMRIEVYVAEPVLTPATDNKSPHIQ